MNLNADLPCCWVQAQLRSAYFQGERWSYFSRIFIGAVVSDSLYEAVCKALIGYCVLTRNADKTLLFRLDIIPLRLWYLKQLWEFIFLLKPHSVIGYSPLGQIWVVSLLKIEFNWPLYRVMIFNLARESWFNQPIRSLKLCGRGKNDYSPLGASVWCCALERLAILKGRKDGDLVVWAELFIVCACASLWECQRVQDLGAEALS